MRKDPVKKRKHKKGPEHERGGVHPARRRRGPGNAEASPIPLAAGLPAPQRPREAPPGSPPPGPPLPARPAPLQREVSEKTLEAEAQFPRIYLLGNQVNRGTLPLHGDGRHWFRVSLPIGVPRTRPLGPVVHVRRFNTHLLIFN